ncbi:MAG: hypothetical protein CVU91_04760 [Firmicutes bacterium HGW-Firmicutes-16]|nr:MAG: hypothetical protein CVU91_04760 [Firmicutes bacterium HGW-Firmicutes-16]
MNQRVFNKGMISLLLTAVLIVSILPLQANASSLLRLDGTDCVFNYPGIGDAISLTNVSEMNTSDRFCTFEVNTADENAVVYGQTTLTLLKSGLLYANHWNGNRTWSGKQVEKTLWANNVLREPSAKNIGSTLTLTEPGYYQIPFDVGGDSYTFSVEVRVAAPDYASYLKTLISTYGILPQLTGNSLPMLEKTNMRGLFYAGLADFDGNGTQELVVLYYKDYKPNEDLDDLGIVYEVWSQQNGELRMLYSSADDRGLPYCMSDSGALASIGLIQSDGKQYLHVRNHGSSSCSQELTDTLFSVIDGKWQKTHTLMVDTVYPEEGDTTPRTSYYEDGAVITEEAYLQAFSKLSRETTVFISSLDNDSKLHISIADYRTKLQDFIASLNVTKTAMPSTASVLVDGTRVQFQAYTIENNNYFKLRDIAAAISGTARQFNVEWDSIQNSIKLISGTAYTKVGGELVTTGTVVSGSVPQNKSSLLLDGEAVNLTAYTIAGNNYFKLRDLGQALHFDVRWDGTAGTILIDTTQDYSNQ